MDYYQIKIASKDYPVFRTVVLPSDVSLAFLHEVIQSTFRWRDYHLYEFKDEKGRYYVDPSDEGDDFREARPKDASQALLRSIFKKRGATLDYTYDFGDCNEVCITFLKKVNAPLLRYFDSAGPNMVEDRHGIGGVDGVWGILRAGPTHAEYKEVTQWLWDAFHLTPEQVLHEPSQEEIFGKVFHLLKVFGSCPRSSIALIDSWMDYCGE